MTQPRTIEQVLEEQGWRLELGRRQWRERPEAPPRPVLTISRQHGAGGSEVARRVGCNLGLEVFDREIIHRIAESAQRSEGLVECLDDKDREPLAEWVLALGSSHADFGDPAHFDLIVNTGVLGVGGAVSTVEGALASIDALRPSLRPDATRA